MHKSAKILQTKLFPPPVGVEHVHRDRLIEKLSTNYQCKSLILISAPPGYGKSYFMSCWLKESKLQAAWISLDNDDNDLRLFLEYVIASIQKNFPDKLQKTAELIHTIELPPVKEIANVVINELNEIEQEFVMVLDDYHFIKEQKINDLIDYILLFPPENMHMCIITRRDSHLKINSLRSYDKLVEIRMNDLAFNTNEISRLYNILLGISISESLARSLYENTEGWVAGLRLAAHSIDNIEQLEKILNEKKGHFRLVSDYFIDEVLSKQSVEIQNYLMKISLFDRFCSDLIDDVIIRDRKEQFSTNGEDFIKWLQESNLFVISLDADWKWFRYHHEFQQLLQVKLRKLLKPEQITEIYLNSSSWFEKNEFIEESIDYALRANNTHRAEQVILNNWIDAFNRDDWLLVHYWMEYIPANIVNQSVALLLIKAFISYSKFNLAELPVLLKQIEELGNNLKNNEKGYIAFFRSVILYFDGHGEEAIKMIEKARSLIPEKEYRFMGSVWIWWGFILSMNGRYDEAIKQLKKPIATSNPDSETILLSRALAIQIMLHLLNANQIETKTVSDELLQLKNLNNFAKCHSWYYRGSMHWWGNDLDQALIEFEQLINYKYHSNFRQTIDAYIAKSLALQELGKSVKANEVVDQLISFAEFTQDAGKLYAAYSGQARLALLKGDIELAEKWLYSAVHPEFNAYAFFWIDVPAVTRCRVLIALNSPLALMDSLKFLEDYYPFAQSIHNKCRMIEIAVLQAIVNCRLNNERKALSELKKAVRLAGLGKWIRPFVEAGREIFDLLLSTKGEGIEANLIEQILFEIKQGEKGRKFSSTPIQKSDEYSLHLIEALTQRELDVLNLISTGNRNNEIAEKLFLSPTTIKKYIYNIYQKLNVHNRIEAVNKAAEMNLLS
jgi:LuxR family maltose regulon positive regulatory protein